VLLIASGVTTDSESVGDRQRAGPLRSSRWSDAVSDAMAIVPRGCYARSQGGCDGPIAGRLWRPAAPRATGRFDQDLCLSQPV